MKTSPVALFALTAALNACAVDDQADADLAADSSEGTSTTSSLLTLATDSADPSMTAATPAAMATTALTNAGRYLLPAGCATGSVAGATVTWSLRNCTGPYGLVNTSGTLVATYSDRTATGFTVRVTGDLTINRGRHQPDATAVITVAGASRTAAVTVNGRGTGPRGVAYSNTGMYTATWDGSCLGLSGAVTTAGGGASGTLTFASFRRCRGVCPDSGGRITLAGSGGRTVTLAYNGSATATATVRGSTTRTYSIPLYCAAQ